MRHLFAIFAGIISCAAAGADRPNILWLTTEDMSPNLGCYGDSDAITPRLDAFALESVRYNMAFSTAPVCSPSRSCLITGMYATSLGTQRLRSTFPVPVEFGPFTEVLRKAGWHCTNNVKTDYNLKDEQSFMSRAWDESSNTAHWRSRKKNQPFFAVFNFMTTHQSRTSAWPHEQFETEIGSKLSLGERHNPSTLTLPPFYPDTAESRKAWARYHDCITRMDTQFGELLDQLSSDRLAEDTIVFFYADHGMGMPRGKRCLQDSGLRVPLLIRFPKKWSHLASANAGESTDRLVSFVDFAPTVLSLCGLPIPSHFQGSAFLGGRAASPRQYVFGARDRVDEAFDVSRSVRNDRWLYIRNFMPYLSWMQPEGYSDQSTFRQELKHLAAEKQLGPAAMMYAAPRRPIEELYDTHADPQQIHNLAMDPHHSATISTLRSQLRKWQMETHDTGFFTEPQLWSQLSEGGSPWDIARNPELYPLNELLAAAGAVGDHSSAPQQREWLTSPNDTLRYWAAVGFTAQINLEAADFAALRKALNDPSAVVRIEAATALAQHGEAKIALPTLTQALKHQSHEISLHAARALELMGPAAQPLKAEMQSALEVAKNAEDSGDTMAMFIRFSLESALKAFTP